MSIERIKQEAAKADQRIAELGRAASGEQTADQPEAEQPDVNHDAGVAHHAATEDAVAGVPAANELAGLQESAAKWEQRYRSLDGMIQARDRQIEQLHQLLAAMQQAPAKADPAPDTKPSQLVRKEDEEAFGADLIDLQRRVVQEQSAAYTERLEARLAELEQRLSGVAQTTAVSAQERFQSQLSDAAPEWRKLDSDQGFIDWLSEAPMRQRLFAEAAGAQSVKDVAYFFNEYARLQPPAAKAPAVDPRLERQLAPGKSKSVATPAQTPSDKKQWTRSEIAAFYTQGRKQHSPEEYTRLERDLFAAQRDGRVDFSR